MSCVRLDSISKVFPFGVRALDDLSLEIADGELVVLVGPSGCGKSTTLRLIAGLEQPTRGTIRIGERDVTHVAPHERDVAMVFQDYALYPHMSVARNMAFSLLLRRRFGLWDNFVAKLIAPGQHRRARDETAEIQRRVQEAAHVLDIADILHRRPAALSGGQRQRAALGRAMVRAPKVFLFDEPLSSVDALLRSEMRRELKRTHRRLRTTTLYVTHDQEEALMLGDRIVVMSAGRIQQIGAPREIYAHPANRFVAGFIGAPAMNFIEGRLLQTADAWWFDDGANRLRIGAAQAQALRASAAQAPVVIGIRSDLLTLAAPQLADGDAVRAKINAIEPLGERIVVRICTAAGAALTAHISAASGVAEGDDIALRVNLSGAHFFAADADGRNLTGA